ncbi:hypothetical protein PLA107_034595 (plasmid) [Pseudomonas amygdali pv. lachrymans str. M301315]|uniref:Uncharacterized protein n=2 Tax=Pseudomonas amygdali pv. lachrymans TaxID=53707 RepID=A0AAD0PX10_PSEAV|nr:hypothetical protein PLA107_034595 [Pseudomonas amygdali pv. lachrymans str. M301315]
MVRLEDEFHNILERLGMSWPVCFDAKTIKRLEKSWSPYEDVLPQIRALMEDLYEMSLSEGHLTPGAIRDGADYVVKAHLGLYPIADWSKIVYRLNTTLENLVLSVERSLTIDEVNLIEARFELNFFEEIDQYGKKMALECKSQQALALAERMNAAGVDSAIALLGAVVSECASSPDAAPIVSFLQAATDEALSWTDGSNVNCWNSNHVQTSPLVHLERLLAGDYPWSKLSIRFVEQRLQADTYRQGRKSLKEYVDELSVEKKTALIAAAYSANPPADLVAQYREVIKHLLPEKLLDQTAVCVMNSVIQGNAPDWLDAVLKTAATPLAKIYPTIPTVTYQICHSSPQEIRVLDLPERYAQGMSSLCYAIDEEFRESFDQSRFVDWTADGQKLVVSDNVGETLVGFFREVMPHLEIEKRPKSSPAGSQLQSLLDRSDAQEFIVMSGAILKGLERQEDIAEILVRSFPDKAPLVKDFADVLNIPKEALMKSHWYRDFHMAGDLGL